MKKITLLFTITSLMIGTLNFNAQELFSFSLADQTEAEAFVASLPSGGLATDAAAGSFGNPAKWGVKLTQNKSITYTATGLAAGTYTMEATMVRQNTAVIPWVQGAWETSGGTPPTPFVQSGTNGAIETITETVTITSAGDYTFGIIKGNHGSQMVIIGWKVTGATGPSSETDITSLSLPTETAPATIDAGAHTVSIEVLNGTDLSSLSPTIELSSGATVSPLSGISQDFSGGAVNYTVTAEDTTTTQIWTVTVIEVAPASPLFDFSLADEAETNAFVDNLPTGYGSIGTIEAGSWSTTWGVKLLPNSGLTYESLGLPASNYTMEAIVMVQNNAFDWDQGFYPTSGGTPSVPTTQPAGDPPNTFVSFTKNITIVNAGNYTFDIVRAGGGAQMFVKSWKLTEGTLSINDARLNNNLSVTKTGISLKAISGKVQIIDLLGRVLASKELKKQEKLDFNFSGSTIYLIKVNTPSGTISRKVLFN